MADQQLKIGLPKGSLQQATFELFEHAGWRFSVGARAYFPSVDDPEITAVLLRKYAQVERQRVAVTRPIAVPESVRSPKS